MPPPNIEQWIVEHTTQANDTLRLVIMTDDYNKKSGIYSAERDDTSKPVVIDWGDGTVEQINLDVSQKVHEYVTVSTFNVVVENIKSYAVIDTTWEDYYDVKQTLYEVIAFPESISCIPRYSFTTCDRISSITIPSNILLIDDGAFSDNYLNSLTLNNGLLSIGDNAFSGSSLKDVQIPDSTEHIGDLAFANSYSLSSVSIGAGCSSFGSSVFEECYNLQQISVSPSNQHFKSDGSLMLTKDGTGFVACIQTSADMVIPNTVKRFPDGSFSYNHNLTSIVMPSSIDYMGEWLFSQSNELVNVVLPTNITSIPESTFADCYSLTSISIPSTVETIADYAFNNCFKLSSISCPATDIGYNAFAFCISIESATFTVLDAESVQGLITSNNIFEGINFTLDPDGYPDELYDKTVHITCSDSAFEVVFYADGSIEFIEAISGEGGGGN